MGIYSEYLNRNFTFQGLEAERKKQLAEIERIRGRDVLVYAANVNPRMRAPVSIEYSDLLPINDQLTNLSGTALDLLIETGGGSGEVAEDIVKLIRGKYNDVAALVPGTAKSAGTLIVMAADDILMEAASSLGPIDAQIIWQGKQFSAEALLEGLRTIQDEVSKTGQLNLAYLPILQQISPGELQNARNALDFARNLVRDWLATYKFKNWTTHSSSSQPVTDAERKARAREIAKQLSDHSQWLTHGRSIKIADLEAMRLKIVDYSSDVALSDAVRRYHTLLQMLFDTNCYKVIETSRSQIYRFFAQQVQAVQPRPVALPGQAAAATATIQCSNCGHSVTVQARFDPNTPVDRNATPWPADNKLQCPNCGTEQDLADARRALEAQTGQPLLA